MVKKGTGVFTGTTYTFEDYDWDLVKELCGSYCYVVIYAYQYNAPITGPYISAPHIIYLT